MTENDLRRLRRKDLLQLLFNQGKESARLADRVEELERQLKDSKDLSDRLKGKLDDKDASLERLKLKLDDKDEQIDHLKKRLDEKDKKILAMMEA